MHIVLHIGPHKTGTSYIQKECAERRHELSAVGVMYPQHWNSWLHGHTGLYHQLRQGHYAFFNSNYDKFIVDVLADTKVVLFSNENLEDLDERGVAVLANKFKQNDTKVLYYIRNWKSLLRSTFQESVKHGSRETLAEYAFRHTTAPRASPVFNYNIVLDKYAKEFGKENIVVRVYDNVVGSGLDIFEDVLSLALEAPPAVKGRGYFENPSLTPVETEIVRLLNAAAFAEDGREPGIGVREAYFEIRRSMLNERAELAERCKPYARSFSTDEFMSEFPAIEEELLSKYEITGPRAPGGLFGEQNAGSVEYLSTDFLLDRRCRELIDMIREIVRNQLKERLAPAARSSKQAL